MAIVEEYSDTAAPRLTLVRLLPDSQPVEGTASFTLGDFGYPVREVAWRSETIAQGGATYTRQVPEYVLGSVPTHEIVVRTRSLTRCSYSKNDSGDINGYYCQPYGSLIKSYGSGWVWR